MTTLDRGNGVEIRHPHPIGKASEHSSDQQWKHRMGGSKKNIANEEKNGRKIFDGLTEDIHQLAKDQSYEERKQIQAHHEERSGLQAQSGLLLGGDGKVGGIDACR